MRRSRARSTTPFALPLWLLVIALVAASIVLVLRHRGSGVGDTVSIYYAKQNGATLATWSVSLRPAQRGESAQDRLEYAALYAATQAVAGPPISIQAIRFPRGTHVRSVNVSGSTATVDLSGEVGRQPEGSFAESGEFKGLVWTLTGLPGISAVDVTVDGRHVDALPGGHLALDQPLHRSDW